MADIRIHKHFTDIVLDDPNPGRQRYWHDVMSQLEEQPFAVLKIGVRMSGTGSAYFCVNHGIVNICLSKDAATFKDNKLKFAHDEDFAIFVHEAAHFQHIVVDGGVWKAPSLTNCPPMDEYKMEKIISQMTETQRLKSLDLRNIEYEAGWRAVFNDKIYKLFPNDRTLLDLMIKNTLTYDICRQPKEVAEKLCKSDDESNDYMAKHVIQTYSKYSEIADPNHIFKGM